MAIVCARSKATHYLFTALFYNVVGEGPSIVGTRSSDVGGGHCRVAPACDRARVQ
jgi:hypothetical protein